MKIGLLSTLSTNIGDDFIREGILLALDRALGRMENHSIQIVNKHRPNTLFAPWHPRRWISRGQRLFKKLPRRTRFDRCQLIIQSGAPVFWPNAHRCEWAGPFWYEAAVRARASQARVCNLAAGSCFNLSAERNFSMEGQCISRLDAEYFRHILSVCHLTTVRDTAAEALCREMGHPAARIPCAALLCGRKQGVAREAENLVLINYMKGGGHFASWDYRNDPQKWEETVRRVAEDLRKRHRVLFLCHNREEKALADKTFPGFETYLPKNHKDFFDIVRRAQASLCNRMHASMGMAGIGIPSVAVCTDTRLLMVREIGLPVCHARTARADELLETMETMMKQADSWEERLMESVESTLKSYTTVIKNLMDSSPHT